MMRSMVATDLATRAMAASRLSLGIREVDRLDRYEVGTSEAKRQADLAAALEARDRRERDMVDAKVDIMERVRTEGSLLYVSSRPYAGLLAFVGRVSGIF